MRQRLSGLARILIAVMAVFCLIMALFLLLRGRLDFQMEDLSLSLETSRGRERKQQAEYDEVTAQLPLTRAELEEAQPLADAAAEEVRGLKEERKRLRAEKKELEQAAETAGQQEQTENVPETEPGAAEAVKSDDSEPEQEKSTPGTESAEETEKGAPET